METAKTRRMRLQREVEDLVRRVEACVRELREIRRMLEDERAEEGCEDE